MRASDDSTPPWRSIDQARALIDRDGLAMAAGEHLRLGMERLGFVKEGHLRERWIVGDEVSDTALYGLLRRDWHWRA